MMFVMDMCTKLLRKNANQGNLTNQYQLQGITRQLCLNTLIHGLYQLQRVIINYDIISPFNEFAYDDIDNINLIILSIGFNYIKEQLESVFPSF